MKPTLPYHFIIKVTGALLLLLTLSQCKSKQEADDKPGSFSEPQPARLEPPSSVDPIKITDQNSFYIRIRKDSVWYKTSDMTEFAEINTNQKGQIEKAINEYRDKHTESGFQVRIQQDPNALFKTFDFVLSELKAANELKYFLVTDLPTANENRTHKNPR
jgi:hypothetical protein